MDEDLVKHTFPIVGESVLIHASGVIHKAELIVAPDQRGVLLSVLRPEKPESQGYMPLDFFSGKPLHCGLLWAQAVVIIYSPVDAPTPKVLFEEADRSLTWDNVPTSKTGAYEEAVVSHSKNGPVKLTLVYTKKSCAFRR